MERTPFDVNDDTGKKSSKKIEPGIAPYSPNHAPAPLAPETPVNHRPERIVPFIPKPLEIYDIYTRDAHEASDTDKEDSEESDSKSKTKSKQSPRPHLSAPAPVEESTSVVKGYEGVIPDHMDDELPEPPSLEELPPISASYQGRPHTEVPIDQQRPPEFISLDPSDQAAAPTPLSRPPVRPTPQASFNQPPVTPNASSVVATYEFPPPPPAQPGSGGNVPPHNPNFPPHPGNGNLPPHPGMMPSALNPNLYPTVESIPDYNTNRTVVMPTERIVERRRPDIPARLAALYAIARGHGTRKEQKRHNERITALENQNQNRAYQESAQRYGYRHEQQQSGPMPEIRDLRPQQLSEQIHPAANPGERPITQPEIRAAIPVLTPEEEQAAAEQAEQSARIQQDAWRRYAVDRHNREITTTPHGEAYHQERQQETGLDSSSYDTDATRSSSASGSQHMQSGQVRGQPMSAAGASFMTSLPSGMTTPELPQGQPTHVAPDHQLPAATPPGKNKPQGSSTAVFWIMLVIIIAAFFVAALI